MSFPNKIKSIRQTCLLSQEAFAKELGVKYQRNEALVVGFENEKEEVYNLLERGTKNGVKGLRVVEKEELMKLEGVYHKLYTLQQEAIKHIAIAE